MKYYGNYHSYNLSQNRSHGKKITVVSTIIVYFYKIPAHFQSVKRGNKAHLYYLFTASTVHLYLQRFLLVYNKTALNAQLFLYLLKEKNLQNKEKFRHFHRNR